MVEVICTEDGSPVSPYHLDVLPAPFPGAQPPGTEEHLQQLAAAGAGQAAAVAHVRQVLCSSRPPVQALLDKGVAAALVRCLRDGSPDATVRREQGRGEGAAVPNPGPWGAPGAL
jgi:hypothetical protein